jgi:hypothetical protein
MKRSIHIFVSLLVAVLLARPFDCFAATTPSPQEMECCLKTKCGPMTKAATCCTNPSQDDQLAFAKAADHYAPLAVITDVAASIVVPPLLVQPAMDSLRHPPPGTPLAALNLPLLI